MFERCRGVEPSPTDEEAVVHATYPLEFVPAYLSSPTRAIVRQAAATPRLSVT